MGAAMPMPECQQQEEPVVEEVVQPRKRIAATRIDDEKLRDWVGSDAIKGHEKTEQFYVTGYYHRVNVWVRNRVPERLLDTFKIVNSYYVEYKDGVITDKTIKK